MFTLSSGAYGQAAPDYSTAVEQLAEHQLMQQYGGSIEGVQVRARRLRGIEGEPTQVRFPPAREVPRGTVQVRVSSQAEGEDEGWALLYIAHFDSVMVAQRAVPSRSEIADGDVVPAWIETTRFRGEPLRSSDFRAMQRTAPVIAARLLHDGRALRSDDVREPYAADTGEAVLMQYGRDGIHLSIACTAREPGFVGDTVRLYSSSTKAMYRARLTGNGTAEWIETL